MKKIRFSKKGFLKLKKKYEDLRNSRPAAVLDLKKAREMGDLSENGYYKAARAKLSDIDRNLRIIFHDIKNSEIVGNQKSDTVGIGSKVKLLAQDNKINLEIVGDLEANPKENKISLLSPMGESLDGRKVGEKIEVNTPGGKIRYKIIEVV